MTGVHYDWYPYERRNLDTDRNIQKDNDVKRHRENLLAKEKGLVQTVPHSP